MKKLIELSLSSCTNLEKEWHESARIIGAKSVYIRKDGTKTTGEEWYKNHPQEDEKFREKYGEIISSTKPSQTFVKME